MLETLTANKPESHTGAAESMTETVAHKADDAACSVGSGMTHLAHTIHDHAPDHGTLGKVASCTAETLDTAGHYLRDEGVTGMGHDLTNMIRRNPGPALLVGLGVGFLLACATRR